MINQKDKFKEQHLVTLAAENEKLKTQCLTALSTENQHLKRELKNTKRLKSVQAKMRMKVCEICVKDREIVATTISRISSSGYPIQQVTIAKGKTKNENENTFKHVLFL